MKKHDLPIGYTIFVAVVCLGTLAVYLAGNRLWLADFRVYYRAAEDFVVGGPVYGVSFDAGSGFYKYSPTVLFFFLPYTIFPYKAAVLIHSLILSGAFWYSFILIRDILRKTFFQVRPKREGLLLSLSFIPVLIFLSRELYLGNINILLLTLALLAIRFFLEERPVAAALLMGIVFLSKPYFVILLLPLLFRKQFSFVIRTLLVSAAGFLLPFIVAGPARSRALYSDWFTVMQAHGQGFPDRNSLGYILRHHLFGDQAPAVQYFASILLILLVIVMILYHERTENGTRQQYTFMAYEWMVLLAMIPAIFKADWVQFLYGAPLVAWIIFTLAGRKQYALIPLLVVLLFFYSANSDDLLGRDLSHRLFVMGVTGISNLLLILLSWFLLRDQGRLPKENTDG